MKLFELFIDETTSDMSSNIKNFELYLKEKYPLKTLFLSYSSIGDMKVASFMVEKDARNLGTGTQVMQEITKFADSNNLRVILTPGLKDPNTGTTSRNRLIKFYKKFGFLLNQGRNKDFRISEIMYRIPRNLIKYPT